MTKFIAFLSVAASLALTACGNDNDDTDLTKATTQSEADALAASIKAGDFTELQLGAKVIGAEGPQVESAFSNAEGNFADVRSYVACPKGVDPCDPNEVPAGTLYTYVYVVTPGEDNDPDRGSGEGPDNSRVERANSFLMTQPAYGFTGAAGYAKPEAKAAMGARGDVVITCDEGKIVWTLDSGDGGDQWENGEPVTFYWQSTVPPAGAAQAYEIHADYTIAKGKAPYPKTEPKVPNACQLPAPAKI